MGKGKKGNKRKKPQASGPAPGRSAESQSAADESETENSDHEDGDAGKRGSGGGQGESGATGIIGTLQRLDGAIGVVEHAALAVFLGGLIVVGTYQAIAGNLLSTNDPWPFELIRYSVFFIAMTGAALAAQRHRMITMDFVTRMLKPRAKVIVRVLIACFVVAVCILTYVGGMQVRETSASMNEHYEIISPDVGLLALPVGALLIAFHYALHAFVDVIYLARGELPPEPCEPSVH